MHVQLQPAFVLHHRPYRDTSRILELYTRDHGRVCVFARGARGGGRGAGARRSTGTLISILQPFNPLLVSWSGRGEAGQLTGAEFDGPVSGLPADRLVSGFYLNELLLKLFARHDSHPEVYALYADTLADLKAATDPRPPLRLFEKRLLDMLGYGLALGQDEQGLPLDPEACYYYRLEQGPVRAPTAAAAAGAAGPYEGSVLLALAREELSDLVVCVQVRPLLRAALDRCLEGRELKTRQVMRALRGI